MSALSTHHKRKQRSDKKRSKKWRTQASDKKFRNTETVTYSSRDRSPKTRATARRNRSKAKTWLLKDRGNARRSYARSRGKMRKTRSQEQSRNSQAKLFPLTSATLPKWCNSPKMMHSHSQSPVHNKFFKNQTSLPLVRSLLSKFSPLLAHAHIKATKT